MPKTKTDAKPITSPQTDPILDLPLDVIEATALVRDRTNITEDAMEELRHSIIENGLRQPIEVYEMEGEPKAYGLISGARRLQAIRDINELFGGKRFTTIAAFLRAPKNLAAAYASMVEENEIRASLSPYERGRIAVRATKLGIFPTIEDAINTLYASASPTKRSRLRAMARLAEALGPVLATPEALNRNQAMRLVNALNQGFGEILYSALEEAQGDDAQTDWQTVRPYIEEAEAELKSSGTPTPRPGRPRRILRPSKRLTVRREVSRRGYILRFTGGDATSEFVDAVLDVIERQYDKW